MTRRHSFHVAALRFALIVPFLVPLVPPGHGSSALTEDVNQIVGHVRWTNQDPTVREILDWYGAPHLKLWISVSGQTTGFGHWQEFFTLTPTLTEYSIDTLSTDSGERYSVWAALRSEGQTIGQTYNFLPILSEPVLLDPAADVVADIEECAAVFEVQWLDASGESIAPEGASLSAWAETEPGSGEFAPSPQATLHSAFPLSSSTLIVRGDGTHYRVEGLTTVAQSAGAITRLGCETFVDAPCDQVVEVTCRLPEVGEPGAIVGLVDLQGVEEESVPGLGTRVLALGPFGSLGYASIESVPAEGAFRVDGLPASSTTSPATPYQVNADLYHTHGGNRQWFRTPTAFVEVSEGGTADLGSTLVVDPGRIGGDIVLDFAPPRKGLSCGEALLLSSESSSPYFEASLRAIGDPEPFAGASHSTAGGLVVTGFHGSIDPAAERFAGGYEMILGGLAGRSSHWLAKDLLLSFVDRSNPGSPNPALISRASLSDFTVPGQTVSAGSSSRIDYHYCLGQLNLEIHLGVETGWPVHVFAYGSLEGGDGSLRYSVSSSAGGRLACPSEESCESDLGLATFCLPAGTYQLRPAVVPVNTVEYLLPLTVDVGCRQVLDVSTELLIGLLPVTTCAPGELLGIEGSVDGRADIEQLTYTLNGGTTTTICTNCGDDPVFSAELADVGCSNDLIVTATDSSGRKASVATSFDCLVAVDSDTDGIEDCSDCAPDDGHTWAQPGQIADLRLRTGTKDPATILSWAAPEEPGATSISYILMTEENGSCAGLETGAELLARDYADPAPGGLKRYLVTARNSCGRGPLGEVSGPRIGCD